MADVQMTYNGYQPSGYSVVDWSDLVSDGWKPIMRDLQAKSEPDVVLTQVKEKFGTLRIYYNGGSEAFAQAVNEAERASANVCEDCGQPGSTRDVGGWLRTVCDNHVKRK
jgi:hypothetical protein